MSKDVKSVNRKRLLIGLSVGIASLLLASVVLLIAYGMFIPFPPTDAAGVEWQGVTVGVSTTTDVISQLGPPDRIETKPLNVIVVYNYYEGQLHSEIGSPDYQLTFRWNKLVQITDFVPLETSDSSLETFIAHYEKPDYVTWTGPVKGRFSRSLVFLDDGVVLIVFPEFDTATSSVAEASYIQPCSLECVKQAFPFHFGGGLPNPEFGPLQPIDKIEDPWGFTTQ